MVSSGGSGSSQSPNFSDPSGNLAGYGSATTGNGMTQQNVLGDGGSAVTSDMVAAARQRQAAQNQAAAQSQTAASSSSGYDPATLRAMLSQIMNPPRTPQQQAAMEISALPGARGSYAGGGGGASYTGSSAMRR